MDTIDPNPLQRALDRQPPLGYAFAAVVVGLAVVVRLALDPALGRAAFPLLVMFPAIVLVGWGAGRGPALAAVPMAMLAAQWFLVEPRQSLAALTPDRLVGLAVFAVAGVMAAWFGTAQRTAERVVHASAQARRGSEEQAQALLRSVPHGAAFVVDASLVVRNAGGELGAEVVAGPLDELVGRPVQDAFVGPAPDAAWYRQALGGARVERETEAGARTLAWRGVPLRDGDGAVRSMLLTVADITERRRAREAERASERRLRSLANAMPQLVWMADADGRVVDYNSRVDRYAGLTRNDDGSWSWRAVLHPDDLATARAAWQQAIRTGEPLSSEARLRMSDGSYRWHLNRGSRGKHAGDDTVLWYGTSTDIQDLKRTEVRLRESVRQAELAVRLGRIGILRLDPATGIAELDARMQEVWGGAPASGPMEALLARVDNEDSPRVRAALARALEPGAVPTSVEFRVRADDGGERWLRANGQAEFADGRPLVFVGTARDITDRRASEEALRRSEERYRAFVANSGEGIWCLELEPPVDTALPVQAQIDAVYAHGRFVECNEAMARMYGYGGADELLDRPLSLLLPPDEPAARAYLASIVENGYAVHDAESEEQGADGRPRWFLNGVRGVVEEGRLVRCWGTQRDVTELKRMQANLAAPPPSP